MNLSYSIFILNVEYYITINRGKIVHFGEVIIDIILVVIVDVIYNKISYSVRGVYFV